MSADPYTADDLDAIVKKLRDSADKIEKVGVKMRQNSLPEFFVQLGVREKAITDLDRFTNLLGGMITTQVDAFKAGENWADRLNRRKGNSGNK